MEKHKTCPTCNFIVPDNLWFDPIVIPCSKYHVRCLRCRWPVAYNFIGPDSICDTCHGQRKNTRIKIKKET